MPKKYRILTPATLLLVIHIKAAMAGTHGAAIDRKYGSVEKRVQIFELSFTPPIYCTIPEEISKT